MQRTIKVRIVKETRSKVNLHFLSLNRTIPVPKKDFNERVESGLYEVVSSAKS